MAPEYPLYVQFMSYLQGVQEGNLKETYKIREMIDSFLVFMGLIIVVFIDIFQVFLEYCVPLSFFGLCVVKPSKF